MKSHENMGTRPPLRDQLGRIFDMNDLQTESVDSGREREKNRGVGGGS